MSGLVPVTTRQVAPGGRSEDRQSGSVHRIQSNFLEYHRVYEDHVGEQGVPA